MAFVWGAFMAGWVTADMTAKETDKPPAEAVLQRISNHSLQSNLKATSLCDCFRFDLQSWRKKPAITFKKLQIIDFCLHEGSPKIITWGQSHLDLFDNFGETNGSEKPKDEDSLQIVRLKKYAAELATLLRNEESLQVEKGDPVTWKHRMGRIITKSWDDSDRAIDREAAPPPPYTPSGQSTEESSILADRSDHLELNQNTPGSSVEASSQSLATLPNLAVAGPSQNTTLSRRRQTSTLVTDSLLETIFREDGRGVCHISYVANIESRQRRVRKETRWLRERKIGSAASSSIWLEKCVDGDNAGQLRAVKEVPKKSNEISAMIDYTEELEAIAKFSHQKYSASFVQSSGWYENNDTIFVSMDFCLYGDLRHHMWHLFPEEEAKQVVSQILEALGQMHDNGFIHRDLNPSNILVVDTAPQWWVKVGDFGLSRKVADATSSQTMVESYLYLAPEARMELALNTPTCEIETSGGGTGSNSHAEAANIWASGVIAFQLLTNQIMSDGANDEMSEEDRSPHRELVDAGASEDCIDLLEKLLATLPELRPSASQALAHAWLLETE